VGVGLPYILYGIPEGGQNFCLNYGIEPPANRALVTIY